MRNPFKRKSRKSAEKPVDATIRPAGAKDIYLKREEFSATADHFMKRPAGFMLKGPIFIIFAILFAALIYSFFAEVKVKVTVPVIVAGEEYVVQSPVVGSISAIYVNNGDMVEERDAIISILSEGILINESNIAGIVTDMQMLEKQFRLVTTAVEKIEKIASDYGSRSSLFRANVASQADFDYSEGTIDDEVVHVSEENWKQSEYFNMVERLSIRLESLWKEYQQTKVLLDKQEKIYNEDKKLFENDVITEYQLVASQEKYLNLKGSVSNIINSFKIEIFNTLENLLEQRSQIYNQYNSIKQELEQSEIAGENIIIRDKLVVINSKYPGEVVELSAKSYEYIGRGTQLLTIVRGDMPKFGRMYISDGDMGKVAPGQKITVKFEAYPYQEYGVQSGSLVNISPDPQPGAGGIQYAAKMDFDNLNPKIDLKYGMSGVAEINTGSKRMIETVFMPITKIFDYFEGTDGK
ncbi:MAG: HlyD family secretion protein [Candidatus Kapaibacterium sp.]